MITRGLAELSRLGLAMGGELLTFAGLAGMGDLVATCISRQSRNRYVGEQLGKGRSIDEIVAEMRMVAEGIKTSRVVVEVAEQYGVDMPIAQEMHAVIHEGRSAEDAYRGLLRRGQRVRAPRDARVTSMRSWVLRRAMGRLRITDDTVRHLSTFQRLGEEDADVDVPADLVPVGAQTLVRALRTRAATQLGAGWVWPTWLERQNDPSSPSFVPRGSLPFLVNATHRNWTAVGNLDARREAIVDPGGLVTPWYDGWSLDWWIGADDRWHVPSREVAVRQRLVDATPVVETAMSIPSGDAVAAGVRRAAQQRRGRRRADRRRDRERVARPGGARPRRAALQPRGPGRHRAHRPPGLGRRGRRTGGPAAAAPAPAGGGLDVPRRRLGGHGVRRRRRGALGGAGPRPRRAGAGGLRVSAGPRGHLPRGHPARGRVAGAPAPPRRTGA